MSKTKTCPKCGGSGELDHCGHCNGSGKVRCSACNGAGEISNSCSVCGGRGKVEKTRWINCPGCGGSGMHSYYADGTGSKSRCGTCNGRGQVEDRYDDYCPNCNGAGHVGVVRECGTCNGTGRVTCPRCGGTNAHEPSTCDRCDGKGQVEVYTSSSSSSEEGTWWEAVLGLLVLIALCWGGWRGYKWLFGERGGSEVITEVEIMEKWEEHLEKRREAFDDGKPEKEIEAKGLRNYTWDEWQEKFKKEHEAQAKQEAPAKTRAQELGEQAVSAAKGLGDKAKSLWQNITSDEIKDPEAELKRLNTRLAELEGDGKTGGQQVAASKPQPTNRKSVKNRVTIRGNEAIVTVISEGQTRQEAWKAAFRTAVKSAVCGFVCDHKLLEDNKDRFEECLNTVGKADVKRYKTFKDLQIGREFSVGIEATIDKNELVPKFAKVFPCVFAKPPVKNAMPVATGKSATNGSVDVNGVVGGKGKPTDEARAETEALAKVEAEARRLAKARAAAEAKARAEAEALAKAEAEAGRLAKARTAAEAKARAEEEARAKARRLAEDRARKVTAARASTESVGSGQPNGTGHKASKDSKAIRIVVHGKGKTKDAAVRWALRDAVFKTVGTWVDSKSRIQENREKVVAQVKTITEADVPKFEVLETQEKDGGFVVKVRASVSKKKIAPKFAEIFPDVFVIE